MKQSNSTNGNPNKTKAMPVQYGIPKSGPTSQNQETLLKGIPVGFNNAWDNYEPDTNLPYGFGKNPSDGASSNTRS